VTSEWQFELKGKAYFTAIFARRLAIVVVQQGRRVVESVAKIYLGLLINIEAHAGFQVIIFEWIVSLIVETWRNLLRAVRLFIDSTKIGRNARSGFNTQIGLIAF